MPTAKNNSKLAATSKAAATKARPVPAAKRTPVKPALAKAPIAAAAAAVADAPAPAPTKTKPPKMVRDSFTMPKDEYATLQDTKQRALGLGHHVKKSELLRAGVKALAAMTDEAFLATVACVPAVKTGRPAKA